MTAILITIINLAYYAVVILVFARFILSWVPGGLYQLREIVWRLTEPIMAPVRRMLPQTSGLDFSPLIILLIAWFVRMFLIRLLL